MKQKTDLTYVELFAGAGGMSLGLEMAGWRCVAHAEIEPHARAVLRHHWPDVPLYGDVTALDGTQFKGVTMVTGGSPCQDLSIAGKRAGMIEGSGTRSSLFFEQVRIWNESQAPFILWENVYGAFSSNAGRDFAAVLTALVGANVSVPGKRWKRAGYVVGPAGIAAWRTLDAQYFGVPQRRRRVFVLGVRAGGIDPAEVFALAESLSGHLAASGEAGEGVAADAGTSPAFAFVMRGRGGEPRPECSTLSPSLRTPSGGSSHVNVVTYDDRGNGEGAVVSSLTGDHQNRVTDYTAIVLRNREGKPGGGKGPLLSEGKSLTLGTSNDQVVFPSVSPTVTSKWAKGSGGPAGNEVGNLVWWNGSQVADALTTTSDRQMMPDKNRLQAALQSGVPRRLTPVECERLMGWPDQHTADGINEKGKAYALADTARYKLCGNGIASPVTAWIGFQMARLLTDDK